MTGPFENSDVLPEWNWNTPAHVEKTPEEKQKAEEMARFEELHQQYDRETTGGIKSDLVNFITRQNEFHGGVPHFADDFYEWQAKENEPGARPFIDWYTERFNAREQGLVFENTSFQENEPNAEAPIFVNLLDRFNREDSTTQALGLSLYAGGNDKPPHYNEDDEYWRKYIYPTGVGRDTWYMGRVEARARGERFEAPEAPSNDFSGMLENGEGDLEAGILAAGEAAVKQLNSEADPEDSKEIRSLGERAINAIRHPLATAKEAFQQLGKKKTHEEQQETPQGTEIPTGSELLQNYENLQSTEQFKLIQALMKDLGVEEMNAYSKNIQKVPENGFVGIAPPDKPQIYITNIQKEVGWINKRKEVTDEAVIVCRLPDGTIALMGAHVSQFNGLENGAGKKAAPTDHGIDVHIGQISLDRGFRITAMLEEDKFNKSLNSKKDNWVKDLLGENQLSLEKTADDFGCDRYNKRRDKQLEKSLGHKQAQVEIMSDLERTIQDLDRRYDPEKYKQAEEAQAEIERQKQAVKESLEESRYREATWDKPIKFAGIIHGKFKELAEAGTPPDKATFEEYCDDYIDKLIIELGDNFSEDRKQKIVERLRRVKKHFVENSMEGMLASIEHMKANPVTKTVNNRPPKATPNP